MAYLGDGNNVCNSLLLTCALVGMDLTVVCPAGYEPDHEIFEKALMYAEETGSNIEITSNVLMELKMQMLFILMFGLVWVTKLKNCNV